MSLASVSIVGNLVRDPELTKFESGRKKTSFHVAVNGFDRAKKEKYAEFYKVELWDKMGDLALSYLRKGNQVTVIGRLSMDRWVDREGKNRCTPLISAGQISLPPKHKSNSSKEPKSDTGDETKKASDSNTAKVVPMSSKEISEEFAGKSIDEKSAPIEFAPDEDDQDEDKSPGSQTALVS